MVHDFFIINLIINSAQLKTYLMQVIKITVFRIFIDKINLESSSVISKLLKNN